MSPLVRQDPEAYLAGERSKAAKMVEKHRRRKSEAAEILELIASHESLTKMRDREAELDFDEIASRAAVHETRREEGHLDDGIEQIQLALAESRISPITHERDLRVLTDVPANVPPQWVNQRELKMVQQLHALGAPGPWQAALAQSGSHENFFVALGFKRKELLSFFEKKIAANEPQVFVPLAVSLNNALAAFPTQKVFLERVLVEVLKPGVGDVKTRAALYDRLASLQAERRDLAGRFMTLSNKFDMLMDEKLLPYAHQTAGLLAMQSRESSEHWRKANLLLARCDLFAPHSDPSIIQTHLATAARSNEPQTQCEVLWDSAFFARRKGDLSLAAKLLIAVDNRARAHEVTPPFYMGEKIETLTAELESQLGDDAWEQMVEEGTMGDEELDAIRRSAPDIAMPRPASQLIQAPNSRDLPPPSRTSVMEAKSVNQENDARPPSIWLPPSS